MLLPQHLSDDNPHHFPSLQATPHRPASSWPSAQPQAFLHRACPKLFLIPCDWHSLATQGKDIWSLQLALFCYYPPMATGSVIQPIHLFFLCTRSWAVRPHLGLCERCSQQRQRSLFTAGLQVFEKLIRSERPARKDAETAS